jgi:hypothetical protein
MARTARWRVAHGVAQVIGLSIVIAGCTTVAQITTVSEPSCRQALDNGLARIFEGQGESAAVAQQLARSTTSTLLSGNLGPRPFVVSSPSGLDYGLFIQLDGASCLVRLYGRQKGFVSYTNNLTYIATEPLAQCRCAE